MEQEARADPELLWIQQIAGGDRGAFEKLYQAYQARIFRYLVRVIGDASTAEELTDDVMVAAWKGAASYRAQSKLSTWLLGIAHHKALNELRRRRPPTVDVEAVRELAEPGPGPEGSVERERMHRCVQRALEQLSPEHREVVELTFYQGCSYQEIAEIMQCPVNTVKTRMFYAKRRLQEALENQAKEGEIT